MVLMYTDTCPHCRGYAPIYQQVANQLQPKLPQLKFYAINASTAPLRSEITRAGNSRSVFGVGHAGCFGKEDVYAHKHEWNAIEKWG
jgi:thiol-disulfide isomerase/thioredoxin